MARSTFYYQLSHLNRPDRYSEIKEVIKLIFHENKGRYGYRRITAELHNRDYHLNHKTVQKLMKQMNLKCTKRKVRYRSYKGEIGKVAPNILNRDFKATAPFQKAVTDVTQFDVNGVKVYLSPILDLYNGEIISYTLSKSPNFTQTMEMLDIAFRKIPDNSNMILHSDQGWQYQMKLYQWRLKQKGIIQSMSRKGNCLDNSVMENFFGILKSEMFYGEKFASADQLMQAIPEYIEYYNNDRIKLKLNGMSPINYRTHSISA